MSVSDERSLEISPNISYLFEMTKTPCVYIVSNKIRSVLYVGVTSNLPKRAYEHKNSLLNGFSKRYKCIDLVYYEIFEDMENAILREKQIKKYRREKKNKIIEENNPDWNDLYEEVF